MKSSCRSPLVVDRVTERAKLAHGSGAVDMTTANIAEVLKLAAKTVTYDNDEKTWLEFRSKLVNYLTWMKYVALLQDAESQAVAKLPSGARSLRLVQRVPSRNGFETWRQLVAENAAKTAGRKFAMLQAVLQPGMSDNLAKFEETWT